MIRDLISDIAYDKIYLSQALSRSKLIAYKIKNENFKNWLRKELEGYEFNDPLLPSWRKIISQMYITHSLQNGQKHSKPVMLLNKNNEQLHEAITYLKMTDPIAVIEQDIAMLKDVGHLKLTVEEAYAFSAGDQFQKYVCGGYREFGKGQLLNIIETTKQKLLDTLLELNQEFPDLSNDFNNTKDNMKKVQNIITNHIYGNNNPTSIAAGVNVEQTVNYTSLTQEDEAKLKSYGLLEEEIEELKKIISTKSNDKSLFIGKAMKWLGSVTASVAGRGLYDGIPAITDFIHKLTS